LFPESSQMNLFADIRTLVLSVLEAMVAAGDLPQGLNTDNVTAEPPRDATHGDMATNAAMVLAKPAGLKPRDIAEKLAALLADDPRVRSAEVAGPGFLNLRLDASVWQGVASTVLDAGTDYGRGTLGAGKRVNVEYVSANPTGPLHVGHTRGAVFGDALASLLAFAGWDVTREYVINDGGAQIDALARSVFLRYQEAHGQEVAFPDGTYPGDYLVPVGQKLKDEVGAQYLDQPEDVWLYNTGKIEACLKKLDEMGLIYKGTLEPPKGKLPDDWEAREQTLFKSTEFGDDQDRPIQKNDGAWTYFAPDIAYHNDKVERGFDALINVFGADHGGYVKRMKAAVQALSDGQVPLHIKLTQLVKLFKNGEEFKMSKRAGNFVLLSDLIREVGKDVTRFVMLTRKNDAPLDFDFDKVMEQSRENPVFYVQYAHARVASVMRKAAEAGIDVGEDALKSADLTKLDHAAELALLKKVAEWPRLVETAARSNEPHRIAFYLYELAGELHGFWNLGNAETGLRFIQEDDPATSQAKIALARSVAIVIASGLAILGVTPAEEMR
jgi:arginyl-tRNA synthetase